jgi:DNA-binding response OmpR family regulator
MTLPNQKALIIDDDVDLCTLLAATLDQLNFDIAIAHTLKDGEKYLNNHHPYLIFLDQNLPDGLGIDFIPEIRSFDANIAIIVITADISGALRQRVLGEENTYFLSKPFSITGVHDVIHTIRETAFAVPGIKANTSFSGKQHR